MKRNFKTLVTLCIMAGFFLSLQAYPQISKKIRDLKERAKNEERAKKATQVELCVQGKLFLDSHNKVLNVSLALRNKDANGEPEKEASVTVNGVKIAETNTPGNYHGIVNINDPGYSGLPVEIKIVTKNNRQVISSGKIDSLLQLKVSNIFPNQKDKIDVGDPVTIGWNFIPSGRKPVDLTVLNENSNGVLFQKKSVTHTSEFVIPVGTIPRRQKISITVETPSLEFPFKTKVHDSSFMKVIIKTNMILNTFG